MTRPSIGSRVVIRAPNSTSNGVIGRVTKVVELDKPGACYCRIEHEGGEVLAPASVLQPAISEVKS